VAATPAGAPGAAGAAAPVPTNTQRDSTVNYEVDKTIRYMQQPMGGLRRVSVAVVVNNKQVVAADGTVTSRALTPAETTQITNLVREAMGFNQERGDTVNVVNSPFAPVTREVVGEIPIWQNPNYIDLALQLGKYLLVGIVLLYLFFKVLKPMLRRIGDEIAPPKPVAELVDETEEPLALEEEVDEELPPSRDDNLAAARKLARKDPKLVANVVKKWVDGDE
jgi:flagellar M-ring protein FliF